VYNFGLVYSGIEVGLCGPFCTFDDHGRVVGPEVLMPARFPCSETSYHGPSMAGISQPCLRTRTRSNANALSKLHGILLTASAVEGDGLSAAEPTTSSRTMAWGPVAMSRKRGERERRIG
jgi:hypothetical protein